MSDPYIQRLEKQIIELKKAHNELKAVASNTTFDMLSLRKDLFQAEQENAELKTYLAKFNADYVCGLEREVTELKRIIAESQKQEHIGTLGWNGKSVMMYAHNHDAVRKLPQGSYKLFALPVIQEGMQLVPIDPTDAMLEVVGTMRNYSDDTSTADADHIEWYKAMLNASKEG